MWGDWARLHVCECVMCGTISLELFKTKHHHLIMLVVFFLEAFIDLIEMDIENYYGPKVHAV